MTQNYRKRAEEFLSYMKSSFIDSNRFFPITYGELVSDIENEVKQVAQEARREENESFIKVIKETNLGDESLMEQEVLWAIDDIKEAFIKAIRSRMIGPEPMEEK